MSIARTRLGCAAVLPAQAPAPETSSDEMLIRRIAAGDQLAMRTLFGRHRVPLYRWLLRLLGGGGLAAEPFRDGVFAVLRPTAPLHARSAGLCLGPGGLR